MSRNIYYKDERLTVVLGNDHAIGSFVQIYDNQVETLDNDEDLVFDCSTLFGCDINLINIPSDVDIMISIDKYIAENKYHKL